MGKRKERRLAAVSNTGRRVKLDLFAEPSGDLGGSSLDDTVGGGDSDSTQHTGLPNSPSSSGQQPQNPLLLLGQYSDDEVDDESNKMPNHAIAENSISDHNDQEGQISGEKGMHEKEVEDSAAQKLKLPGVERDSGSVDVSLCLEGGGRGENDVTASVDLCKEVDLAEPLSVSGNSSAQVIEDASFNWKMVMHEESNQYYYWNTETGETSWEVPDVLAQTTKLSPDQKTKVTDNIETAPLSTHDLSSGVELDNSSAGLTADGSEGASLIPQSKEVQTDGKNMDELVEGHKNYAIDVHQNESEKNLSPVNASLHDGSADNDEHKTGMDLVLALMEKCECLLEMMKSLKGYESRQECHNRMLKCILELEIRLSDIKSLSSNGASLFPFWAHSERQINQLEDVINREIYQLAVCAQMDDDVQATTDFAFKEKKKSPESMGNEHEADGYETSRKSRISPISSHVENGVQNELAFDNVSPLELPSGYVEGDTALMEEPNMSGSLKPDFHAVEDVDMDVDMEVEDGGPGAGTATSGDALSSNNFSVAEQLVQPIPHTEYPSLASGDAMTVPPPPEDEWIPPLPPENDQIPPPPPENDQVPPPPPDEPPDSSYPPLPSYIETGQPLPYGEHYNLAYQDSNYYYGTAVALPSNNFYGHADGSQVPIPMTHAPLYYETVPNTYVDTAPVMVGPVDPVAYYNLQDGSLPSIAVVSSVESSQCHPEPGSVNYDTLNFSQKRIIDDPLEGLPDGKHDVSAVGSEPDLATVGVSSSSLTTQIAAINQADTISTSVADTITVTAVPSPSTAAKVQSKVLRSKKRTVALAPSLRSNKKVSSLVDKWKAAKEELNDNEEDEPDNAYEILEKKRQREIEEWHAKQIASGEAKGNANFQPLGGDWRERVKRRRAQAAKEAALKPTEGPSDENQQPNLVELSCDLPSGWQAYWDVSTKQVYYGNAITSETTWTRPTK